MELDGSRTASSAGKLAGVLERGTDLFAELQHEDSSIPPLRQSASESWTLMRAHRQQPSISLQTLSQFNPLPHSDGRGNRPNGRPSRYLARTRPRVCRAGHARPRGHLRPRPAWSTAGRRPPGRHEPSEGVLFTGRRSSRRPTSSRKTPTCSRPTRPT